MPSTLSRSLASTSNQAIWSLRLVLSMAGTKSAGRLLAVVAVVQGCGNAQVLHLMQPLLLSMQPTTLF